MERFLYRPQSLASSNVDGPPEYANLHLVAENALPEDHRSQKPQPPESTAVVTVAVLDLKL